MIYFMISGCQRSLKKIEGSSFGSFGKGAIRTITIGFRLGTGIKSWASSHRILELVFFFFNPSIGKER